MGPIPAGGAAGILTNLVEKAKSTRATVARQVTASSSSSSTAGAGRGKRTLQTVAPKAGNKRTSNGSESSDVSSGTTVVTKTAAAKKPPVKKTVMGTIKGIGNATAKKPAAAAVATAKTAAPTRVLRRRNQA
jgi:hypothetical protein